MARKQQIGVFHIEKERKKKDSLRVLFFRFHEAMRNINEIPFEFYTCLASRHQDVSFTSSRVQHEWFSLKWPIWKFYLWSSLDSPECWAYRLIFFVISGLMLLDLRIFLNNPLSPVQFPIHAHWHIRLKTTEILFSCKLTTTSRRRKFMSSCQVLVIFLWANR